MIWVNEHWVGLVINLKIWYVDVLDPNRSLYCDRKVAAYMAHVVKKLPYIIHKLCKAQVSQSRGLDPFLFNRLERKYENTRSGDCGSLAIKFLEMHANGYQHDGMSNMDDAVVDLLRKQYVLDIYKELVIPVYSP